MTLTNVLSTSSISRPVAAKSRITQELEVIPHRSQAHLPPTAATPHIAPARKPTKLLSESVSSASTDSSEARGKKASPSGAKSAPKSSKKNKRSSKNKEKGEEFKEKLEMKAREAEERKLKRNKAKKVWE